MQVWIEALGDGLQLTVQFTEKTPLAPKDFECMLESVWVSEKEPLWSRVPEEPLRFRSAYPGPFAFSEVISFLSCAPRQLASSAALRSARIDVESVSKLREPWTLEIHFDGETFNSVDTLKMRVSAIPAKLYELGDFELSQPKLLISDPCYKPGTWCAGSVDAKPGRWCAQALIGPTEWLVRTKVLRAHHESVDPQVFTEGLEDSGLDVGVDSGQCGLFDEVKYPAEAFADDAYDKICDLTIGTPLKGGILAGRSGVVTSSGFGDGSYRAWIRQNAAGKVIAIEVRFIID